MTESVVLPNGRVSSVATLRRMLCVSSADRSVTPSTGFSNRSSKSPSIALCNRSPFSAKDKSNVTSTSAVRVVLRE